jgi:hypothetical protein
MTAVCFVKLHFIMIISVTFLISIQKWWGFHWFFLRWTKSTKNILNENLSLILNQTETGQALSILTKRYWWKMSFFPHISAFNDFFLDILLNSEPNTTAQNIHVFAKNYNNLAFACKTSFNSLCAMYWYKIYFPIIFRKEKRIEISIIRHFAEFVWTIAKEIQHLFQ